MVFRTLIDPEELMNHLSDPSLVVVDCRFSLSDPAFGKRSYLEGHIPGARFVDLERDLSSPIGPTTGRHPLPDAKDLATKLGTLGIDNTTQVVAYDDAQGAFAARLWWLLRWLGNESVAVLNGGYARWLACDFPTTQELPTLTEKVFVAKPDDTKWVTTEFIKSRLGRKEFLLLDARAPERYRGNIEPIDTVAGHIPGAINVPFAGNIGDKGIFKPAATLHDRFAQQIEETSPADVIHMCGSGVTACHNILAMEAAGLSGSRLYAGSWSEWIRSKSHPIASDLARSF